LRNLNLIKSIRKELTPQMSTYDQLGINWKPFVMFFQTPNVCGTHLNTDSEGFRFTSFKEKEYTVNELNGYSGEVSFIIGGSSAFGVGATSDENTISSLMSKQSDNLYLNLGGRAFGSNQELILFNQVAYNFKKIKNVILFSGLNELYLSKFRSQNEFFGPMFFNKIYNQNMQKGVISAKRKILRFFLYSIFKDSINYQSTSGKKVLKEAWLKTKDTIIQYSLKNKTIKNQNNEEQYQNHALNPNFAINQIEKNLFIWKNLSQSLNFKLIYILQPFSKWIKRQESSEEQSILKFSKHEQNFTINSLDENLYLDYTESLCNLCQKLDVSYFDYNDYFSNKYFDNKWIFVDNAHLTDLGNLEVTNKLIKLI
jgi:hypothetical protein